MYVCYLLQLIARKLICFKDHLQLRKIVLNTSTLHLLQESKTITLHQTIFKVYHDSYKKSPRMVTILIMRIMLVILMKLMMTLLT